MLRPPPFRLVSLTNFIPEGADKAHETKLAKYPGAARRRCHRYVVGDTGEGDIKVVVDGTDVGSTGYVTSMNSPTIIVISGNEQGFSARTLFAPRKIVASAFGASATAAKGIPGAPGAAVFGVSVVNLSCQGFLDNCISVA